MAAKLGNFLAANLLNNKPPKRDIGANAQFLFHPQNLLCAKSILFYNNYFLL